MTAPNILDQMAADALAQADQKRHVPIRLTVCNFGELLTAKLPEPRAIIHPILYEGDLAMIYGWRGAGKTWFSLGLAYSIAAGIPFLGWECRTPAKAIYLDGEMRASRLRIRLAMIASAALPVQAKPEMLDILTRDMQPEGGDWPDLGSHTGREALREVIKKSDPAVIVLDNISAWQRSGKPENDAESWNEVATFLMELRSQGRAVVLIHHAGKGGQQRGTSKREDILDTVVALKKPDDYDPADGMRVCLEFEKSRNLDGGDIPSIEVKLTTTGKKAVFSITETQNDPIAKVHALLAMGASRSEILKELGMTTRFHLDRLQKRASAMGRGFTLPDARRKKPGAGSTKPRHETEAESAL
ncbi:AAA family ATPase [Ferrovum sp.]|uniref:AAA family ATPase n=1 Tax=Ferrovum sp. TaxID=2609467 RepID=UPI00261D7D4B|nr:AAA family ATPase [Ferrovum sp.]